MSICEVINDLELYYTRPLDLSPAEEHEKNRQEAKALENEMQLYWLHTFFIFEFFFIFMYTFFNYEYKHLYSRSHYY